MANAPRLRRSQGQPPLATRILSIVEREYPRLSALERCLQIGCALQASLLRLKQEMEQAGEERD